MALALALYVISAVIWVGGMLFAHMMLRPVAAAQLGPPQRLALWVGVFKRFFPAVFASIATLLATGYWMVLSFYGGFDAVGMHIHLMTWIGYVMMLIFLHVFFAPFRRLKQAVAAEDWPAGADYPLAIDSRAFQRARAGATCPSLRSSPHVLMTSGQ